MKKLLLLTLVLLGGFSTMFADDAYIVSGDAAITNENHSWYAEDSDNLLTETSTSSGIYMLVVEGCELAANTDYFFKIKENVNNWDNAFPGSNYKINVPEAGTYTIIYYVDITNKAIRVLAKPFLRCNLYDNWNDLHDTSHEFTLGTDGLTYTYEISSENFSGDTSFRIFSPVFSKSAYPDGQDKALTYGGDAISSAYFNTAESTDWSWRIAKPTYEFKKAVIKAVYNPFANDDFGTWTVTADAYITVSVSNVGYATFSYACPLNFTKVTGFEAYVASDIGDDNGSKYVKMNKVTGAVPAETGLLLVKEGGCTNVEVPVAASAVAPTNLLVATVTEKTVDASKEGNYHYFLASGANGIGFYNLASSATSGANKAYLSTTTELTSGSTPSKVAWTFNEDESSEVDAVNHLKIPFVENNAPMYNLAGQRVNNDYKGVVVKNGKKFINK